MPRKFVPTTALTRPSETPLIVSEFEIHSTMPWSTVPVPSVTMNELTPKTITNSPLTNPTAAPAASAATIAAPIGQPCLALRTAIIIAESASTPGDREVVVARGEHDDHAEREHDQHGLGAEDGREVRAAWRTCPGAAR